MFTSTKMSITIRPTAITRAMMPGPRWLIQSLASGAIVFLVLNFSRVLLLNPQFVQMTASGGSSSLAQCGQRATSSSLITPIGFGLSSSLSSWNGLLGAAGGGGAGFDPLSALGGVAAAFAVAFAAGFAALAAPTTRICWHSLQRIFFPSN